MSVFVNVNVGMKTILSLSSWTSYMRAEMPFQAFASLAETNCWVSKAMDTAYNEA